MRRAATGIAGLTLLLCGAVSACGGQDDTALGEAGDPSAPVTTTPADGAAPTSPPPSTSPTSPGPSVAPATGTQLRMDGLTLRVPKQYVAYSSDRELAEADIESDPVSQISIGSLDNFGDDLSVRAAARSGLHNQQFLRTPTIAAPVEVDGVSMYHLTGAVSSTQRIEGFGSSSTGREIYITLLFPNRVQLAERQQIAQSVLATVELDR